MPPSPASSSYLLAVDTETTGLAYYDPAFAVTLSWGKEGLYYDLADERERAFLYGAFENADALIFHNAKFDIQKLRLVGLLDPDARPLVHDTETLAHLLDEHKPKRLKVLAKELLGEPCLEDEELKAQRRKLKLKKSDGYDKLPREVLIPYAVKDVEYTWDLFHLLYPQVEANPELLTAYERWRELLWVMLDIEAAGLGVDTEYVERTKTEYARRILELELRARDITGKEDFNPNSNPQIREYFESKGIKREKYDKFTLPEINDPLAETILELRAVSKMHGTYLESMLEEQVGGILHPNFRLNNTRTDRMASGGNV